MFKNALVFQIDQWEQPTLAQFEQRLDKARFVPCGATQPESAGWVPPRGDKHAVLAENVAGVKKVEDHLVIGPLYVYT